MKKECAYTQGMLPRYRKGHLFLPQQKRVERHLASCAVCRSRYDAFGQADETLEFLRYLDGNEGFPGRLRASAAAVTRLFFRPLWLALIIVAGFALQHYVVMPLLHDPDLEKLDAGTQPQAAAPQSAPAPTPPPAVEPFVARQAAATAAVEPLVVTITVEKEHEKTSIAQINEAMKEHALLKSLRFSDKVREVSGSLTPDELRTFFSRIQGSGKVTYKRARLAAAGEEVLPFVMKLQAQAGSPAAAAERSAPKQAERSADRPAPRPAEKPVETPAERQTPAPAPAPAQQAQ